MASLLVGKARRWKCEKVCFPKSLTAITLSEPRDVCKSRDLTGRETGKHREQQCDDRDVLEFKRRKPLAPHVPSANWKSDAVLPLRPREAIKQGFVVVMPFVAERHPMVAVGFIPRTRNANRSCRGATIECRMFPRSIVVPRQTLLRAAIRALKAHG